MIQTRLEKELLKKENLSLLSDPLEHTKAGKDSLIQQREIPAKIHKSVFSFSCQRQFVAGEGK